jgi:hypothetical protein
VTRSHATIYDPGRIRTDPSPSRHDEPTAEFYDRCSNPVIGLVRDNLNDWYGEYLATRRYRNDLRGKLLDRDRRQWNSGAWELYVHAALLRMGLGPVPAPLPSGQSIDFVTTVGERVYVECAVLAHADPDDVRRSETASVYAAIDRIDILDYWLDVQIERVGVGPVPVAEFVTRLRAWLLAQDIDTLAELVRGGLRTMPCFDWLESGWLVQVWAIPRSPELRDRQDLRRIGIMSSEEDDHRGPLWVGLLGRMEAKADNYGELDGPYIIAVNAPDAWPDHREAQWAVFGPHPFTEAWERTGFFLRDDGIAHANVSGVLVATALQPHSFTRQRATLYENPAAERPVPDSLWWPRVRFIDGRRVDVSGVEPTDLFGLPPTWPGDPWP